MLPIIWRRLLAKAFTPMAMAALLMTLIASPASADRVVVDQAGRSVTVPDKVERAVVLFHQALDVVVQLGAEDQLVGVLRDWDKRLGVSFRRLAPSLIDLPNPGDLNSVNIEELLSLDPDVVIMAHFVPEAEREKVERAGIPVIQLAFFTVPESERGKRDPELKDEKAAYTEGLIEAVNLLGTVFGREPAAARLTAAIEAGRALVEERTASLPDEERIDVYFAGKNLSTRGSGKYTGVAISLAGGHNVAHEIDGIATISMEQVLAWNPDVIIVELRSAEVADEIRNDPAWQTIKAVRDGRIHVTPEYVKPGGHPAAESVALGEVWMASVFHPELMSDVDLEGLVQDFYKTFYRTAYVAE